MKKILFFFLLIIYGCGDPHQRGECFEYDKVLEVSNHHATRVFITYTCIHGDTTTRTFHWSNTVYFSNDTINCADFFNGTRKYGKIK